MMSLTEENIYFKSSIDLRKSNVYIAELAPVIQEGTTKSRSEWIEYIGEESVGMGIESGILKEVKP